MIPIKPAYFTSEYSSYLYSFVESKRRCGYKYNGEVTELQRLDRFLSSNSQTPDNHSENVIYTWLSKKSNESVKTFSTRNSIYRQLYGYLALENDEPPLPIPPSARERIHGNGFTPYIFSHDEINRMFSAIDNEKNCSKSFLKYAPLLFRLLYATGLRINEALSLRMEDISFEKGCLVVLESKNSNSRLVPMSASLQERVKKHIEGIDNSKETPLFQSSSSSQLSDSSAYG